MPSSTDILPNTTGTLFLLIIDADEADQLLITGSTSRTSLHVKIYTATTAHQGLQLLDKRHFDCILINYKLPDMDGLQLLESINQKSITSPVILIISNSDEHIAAQALRLGASDYLPKNLLTPEVIFHSVSTAIRLKQAEQERLHTEEQLRACQAQLDFLIANTPTAFWNTDAYGNFKYAKGLGFEMIGIKPSYIIGKNFYEVLKMYPRIIRRFQQTLNGEIVQSVDETNSHFFKSHYVPVFDEAGNITGVNGFAIDITDKIKNERELIQAKDLASNSIRVKEQFLANISHEIRTPMNGIIGLANVLHKTNLAPDQHKYLNAIRKSADNLMQIINDLLDISKITSNQFRFEEVEFNLPELVQDIIDLMDVKARERHNQLFYTIDADVPQQLKGDPLRLRQVILNLIGNAIKFTENGEVRLFVKVQERRKNETFLEITVEDTGIGIPKEQLDIIFEGFNQGSNDVTRKYGGTGLGLTISKNIVEMQGGTISVRSQPNVGSAFTISLPFKEVVAQPTPAAGATETEEDTILNKLAGLQVLLAEDNEINQLLTTTILSGWGVETHIANNGLEAIEKAFQTPYDLILMDMQMPEMDGYEAIDKLRSSGSFNADLPIIALTAHTSPAELKRCMAAGANAYLTKPYEPNDLFKIIVRLLGEGGKYKGASVNMKALKGMAENNPPFLLEVLNMYIESTPSAVSKLQELIEAGNLEEARKLLSELYDSVSVLSAKPLQFTFERMASAFLEEDVPHLKHIAEQAAAECSELVELLQNEYDKIQQEL
ncbi:hybrid sensor histidine kinase/response regulator [Pontibacter sp. H249]|uniref:hybrid sensor histidine kinase/response regulator n=1 Tax=Pontibacter sp. H249 TaxID=3133420 RepID=UPI0030BC9039